MSPAAAPVQARVRSYNVGFGDCFLLSFDYTQGGSRHVLIDFGSTKLSGHGASDMEQVAHQIAEDCGGKLHMVVATHRHADHISGFADAGEIIASLDPDLVVQPWTEQPDLAPEATGPAAAAGDAKSFAARAVVARLADMHVIAGLVEAEARRLQAMGTGKKTVIDQLAFLGMENLANRKAVETLARLGRERVYAHFGTKLPIGTLLPGVRIDVLGPPTVEQYAKVRKQVAVHPTEFWHIAASRAHRPAASAGEPLFPGEAMAGDVPQEARWLVPHIDQMGAEELLSLVRILDSAMNNTSLILLFDIRGTLLLFPGDAQIENWSYCLRDAPGAAKIRARIAQTRLYKVGHHGSLNATPKTLLWEAFARKASVDASERLVTLVSTLADKHGSESRGTEVPRRPLMDELALKSELHNTQSLRSRKRFWLDVTLPL